MSPSMLLVTMRNKIEHNYKKEVLRYAAAKYEEKHCNSKKNALMLFNNADLSKPARREDTA